MAVILPSAWIIKRKPHYPVAYHMIPFAILSEGKWGINLYACKCVDEDLLVRVYIVWGISYDYAYGC